MGLEAMKLFVVMVEEDDTSDTSSQFDTVLDIYNERPLPFIIGTREFLENETLGLGAAPEEFSDSDSDSSYASSYSSSDSASNSSSEREKRHSSRSSYRSSSEESSESSVAASLPRRRADSDESDMSGLFGRPSAPETAPPLLRASSSRSSRHRPVFDEGEMSEDDDSSDSDGGAMTGVTMTAASLSQQRRNLPLQRLLQHQRQLSQVSLPAPTPSQDGVPSGSLFGPSTTAAPVAQPPILSAAARMRAAESYSDSDSDWDDDGGLFGTAKK
ncbi:hypothetical protein PRIC2_004335 [Phytophthora ramorum]